MFNVNVGPGKSAQGLADPGNAPLRDDDIRNPTALASCKRIDAAANRTRTARNLGAAEQ